ncbi:MAG TPA: NADH-quinone oxidoreductase subunit J [Chryseosolibacter sp.]|nr:NADH-quinone oxidoreductase subunit J [Chryseosolibacter sp.]
MSTIAFYILYALCAVSAVSLLFIRNLFKAALLLLVCLLSIAGLYVFLHAEFVAVTQILIYAGGLVVVIIFGIMLTTRMSGVPLRVDNNNVFAGLLASTCLLCVLVIAVREKFDPSKVTDMPATDAVRATGIQLMSSHLLPFEVAGVLLLMALVGAAIVSTSKTPRG